MLLVRISFPFLPVWLQTEFQAFYMVTINLLLSPLGMLCHLLLTVFYFRAFSDLMVSSGSSLDSTRPHSRRDLRRSSRSRDTRPQMEEPDYGDDEGTPLPSINPPPGTEIARGVPDPPPHSDPGAGDSS